jgi:hypothetical protein
LTPDRVNFVVWHAVDLHLTLSLIDPEDECLAQFYSPPKTRETVCRLSHVRPCNPSPWLKVKSQGGEHYAVNCPYCNDTRARLSFSHRWGTVDERTGQKLLHLVNCFNEHRIDTRDKQQILYDVLFPRLMQF